MTGKPIGQNLSKLGKKMVSSVYCQKIEDEIRIKVFVTNAFLDSVEVSYNKMYAEMIKLHFCRYMCTLL